MGVLLSAATPRGGFCKLHSVRFGPYDVAFAWSEPAGAAIVWTQGDKG